MQLLYWREPQSRVLFEHAVQPSRARPLGPDDHEIWPATVHDTLPALQMGQPSGFCGFLRGRNLMPSLGSNNTNNLVDYAQPGRL
jgi:hypothetical protein